MRDRIVAEARLWLGTPYKHQHATRGAGCDCLGLIRGVYRNVIGPEPESPPPYSSSWGEVGRVEPLIEAAGRHLIRIDDEPEPGDVLIFRMVRNAVAKHCAILTTPDQMIHAYQSANAVVEHAFDHYWRSRVAGKFRFPGV